MYPCDGEGIYLHTVGTEGAMHGAGAGEILIEASNSIYPQDDSLTVKMNIIIE